VVEEIMHYQSTTGRLLPKAPLVGLIREIMGDIEVGLPVDHPRKANRIQREALDAIIEAVEDFVLHCFQGS
jgi:histone H3/H4